MVTAGTTGISTIRLGLGDGTFGGTPTYAMNTISSTTIAMGDLNNDGNVDLVSHGQVGPNGETIVRLGTGSGTFETARSYNSGPYGTGVGASELGDINGDGHLDLVIAGTATVSRLGAGDGTFGTAVTFRMNEAGANYSVELGDLNGDGVLDIAAAGYNNSEESVIAILANTRSGISPLLEFDLTSRSDAMAALSQFDKALDRLSSQRGQVGAFQSRLSTGINVLNATAENYAAAESRISSADIAHETSELTRLTILQQTSSAVLAQANLQPEIVLKLLSQ